MSDCSHLFTHEVLTCFFSFGMDLSNYEDYRRPMVIQSLTNERKRKVSVADLRVSRRLFVYDSRHNYGSGTIFCY
jgi:hypothetical protein